MRLTARDVRVLEALHAFDGVLADYQIQRLFFTGTSQTRLRLRLLYAHGYVARPDRRRRASMPCMVYWLERKGAAYVAGLSGGAPEAFAYRKEPKWLQLAHDLAVNDFRITVMQACTRSEKLALEGWVPQGEFWAHPDRVAYTDARGHKHARCVRPDGYFIVREGAHLFRFLLELDRATEDNPRFAREKVLPGLAYLKSAVYAARFGHASGRWLVVTTSARRLRNLQRQAASAAGRDARAFHFTTFDKVAPETVLTAPIWHLPGQAQPVALFKSSSPTAGDTGPSHCAMVPGMLVPTVQGDVVLTAA